MQTATMLTACVAPACVNLALNCPAASVALYPTTAPLYTSPISTVLPPLSASASIYAAPSIYASAAFPSTLYPSTILPAASSLYPSVLPTFSSSLYGSAVLPAVSASLYPSTTIYPAATAPIYGNTYLNGNLAYGNGLGANAGFGLNGQLLNYNGNPIDANIRNTITANALGPIIPGIGGAVSAYNNLNLVANGGPELNNILNGGGGGRNPLNAFVRGSFYANGIGSFAPGLSGPLNQLNQLNLLSSLLR